MLQLPYSKAKSMLHVHPFHILFQNFGLAATGILAKKWRVFANNFSRSDEGKFLKKIVLLVTGSSMTLWAVQMHKTEL
jgi:hypothetical protein